MLAYVSAELGFGAGVHHAQGDRNLDPRGNRCRSHLVETGRHRILAISAVQMSVDSQPHLPRLRGTIFVRKPKLAQGGCFCGEPAYK